MAGDGFREKNNEGKGRPPNSPNKITKELRGVISDFLKEEFQADKLRDLMAEMKAGERGKFLIGLAQFVLPRLKEENEESDSPDAPKQYIVICGKEIYF